jgi:hypothetical protein
MNVNGHIDELEFFLSRTRRSRSVDCLHSMVAKLDM